MMQHRKETTEGDERRSPCGWHRALGSRRPTRRLPARINPTENFASASMKSVHSASFPTLDNSSTSFSKTTFAFNKTSVR